jgi:peptidyl-prolyl cis-trans isomerase A (cyclophilin A)/peptidyl-prolyl cis-trans isomerase B (cyclophilin B)
MRARHRILTLRPALALAAVCACLFLAPPMARADDATPSNPEVRVTTNMGSFVIELYPDRAPLTVADFLRYVKEGFYTNTLFHRVVANFVIQGGGHDANPPYDLKPTYPPVNNESGNGLQNKRGAVGLARAAGAHTGNAQFYVNIVDNPELDPLPTRWGYAVFGQIVEGMDVVDRIGVVPTGTFGPFKADAPVKAVVIQSIALITPPGLTTPPASTPPAAPPSATPPAGAAPSGTAPAGTAPPSSQPAASPAAQPGNSGSPSPAPAGTKPATAPPATPASPPKSQANEADQPNDGGSLR